MDAQSALRRCIELFSHNTRFFIIVEDKYKLLKPILSRFCEIYIPEPIINGSNINLYKYNIQQTLHLKEFKNKNIENLKKNISKIRDSKHVSINNLFDLSNNLYEKGYTGLDIMYLIEHTKFFDNILTQSKGYELLIAFNKVRKEFRNEKILILFILHFIFIDKDTSLENFSFM
jgi:hypothetical protein